MSRGKYQRLAGISNNGESAVFVSGADGGRPIIVRSPRDKWTLMFDLWSAMSRADREEAARRMAALTDVLPMKLSADAKFA